jgi:hypothetical protein
MKATDNGKHQRHTDKLILADLKNDERIMAPAPGRRLENHQDVGEEGGNDKFEKKVIGNILRTSFIGPHRNHHASHYDLIKPL